MTELSVSGLKALAYEQFEQGHFAEAAELLEVLESRIGQQASLSNDLAVAYYRKGEHERALARFREAAELQMQAASLLTANLTDMLDIDEDPDVTGEGERWRRFGQGDHVRLYNRAGYIERIGQAGFELTLLGQDYFGACTFESLGLKPESLLYIVRRPDEGDHTGPEHA